MTEYQIRGTPPVARTGVAAGQAPSQMVYCNNGRFWHKDWVAMSAVVRFPNKKDAEFQAKELRIRKPDWQFEVVRTA